MPFLIFCYLKFASKILHRLLECYWSWNVIFICPSLMCALIPPNLLFLCLCFLLHCCLTVVAPPCLANHTAADLEILSVNLSTFWHAWVVCSPSVNIGTNSRQASEWNAVSVHADKNQWLEILYSAVWPFLWHSSWTALQSCIFFLFIWNYKWLFVSSVQCESDDCG